MDNSNEKISKNSLEKHKPKFQRIPLSKRVEVIKFIRDGHTQAEAVDKFNISRAAVCRIMQRKENLLRVHRKFKEQQIDLNQKRLTGIEDSQLEQTLFKWYVEQRDDGIPVSGPLLRKQALIINQKLKGSKNFKASEGWLHQFKKRHSIQLSSVQRKKLLVKDNVTLEFCQVFQDFIDITGYSLDQIYHANEMVLQWNVLPKKTLIARNGLERSKRITVTICANASGTHKIPLFVIGKTKISKNIRNFWQLPIHYTRQKNSLMSSNIFQYWYKEIFIPCAKEKREENENFLLLLDKGTLHPSEDELNAIEKCCNVIFLPSNVSSIVHPTNQGVIEKVRRLYKKNFLKEFLIHDQLDFNSFNLFLKTWDLISCFHALSCAWQDLCSDILKNAWNSLLGSTKTMMLGSTKTMAPDDLYEITRMAQKTLPKGEIFSRKDTNEWLAIDKFQSSWIPLGSEDSICSNESIENSFTRASDLSDSEDDEPINRETSLTKAQTTLSHVNEVQKWLMNQSDIDMTLLSKISDIRTYLANVILMNKFQNIIPSLPK